MSSSFSLFPAQSHTESSHDCTSRRCHTEQLPAKRPDQRLGIEPNTLMQLAGHNRMPLLLGFLPVMRASIENFLIVCDEESRRLDNLRSGLLDENLSGTSFVVMTKV